MTNRLPRFDFVRLIEAECQLKSWDSLQKQDHPRKWAVWGELQRQASVNVLHQSGSIGSHAHEMLRTVQSADPFGTWIGGTGFKPRPTPAHYICRQACKKHLNANACQGSVHQMLNEEGAFHLLVASLDGLSGVVILEPNRQGGADSVIPIMDEGGILILTAYLEPLQGYSQRERAPVQEVIPVGCKNLIHIGLGNNLN